MSIVTCRSHTSRGVSKRVPDKDAEILFHYIGGATGSWRITKAVTHAGLALKPATHVQVSTGSSPPIPAKTSWMLRGYISNTRYVTREETIPIDANPWMLPRAEATCAALIPIRKSPAWWDLAVNQRRDLLEIRSQQVESRLGFLPAILNRLHFSRGRGEPFDFVTWFEYAPQDAAIFDELSSILRSSEEWEYVEREIDIRLVRDV